MGDDLNPDQNNDESIKKQALKDAFLAVALDGVGDIFEEAGAARNMTRVLTESERLATLSDEALLNLTKRYSKELNIFFETEGEIIPEQKALL